jgi:cathepsin F
MSDKWSSYDAMKSALPSEMVEMAGQGPDAVTGQSFSRRLEGSVGSMSDGEFAWASEDDCAACTTYPGFKEYTSENRPTNFDWRELGAVTSVKNQKYCGSCWTFSTAQDIEGTHFLATGNLTSFSEQQFVACDTYNYGCDGGWMFAAMQYVADFGILVSEEAYPYMGVMMTYNLPTPTCDTDLLNSKLEGDGDDVAHIEGYQMVAMGAEYEDLMATYMLKNGPLSIAINANGMDYYVHGIVGCETIAGSEYCEAGAIDAPSDGDSTMEHTCNPTDLDHGVLLVAYGEQDGVDYWVIKNSWAETWGEDGYYRIERGVNKCGVSNFAQHSVYKKA